MSGRRPLGEMLSEVASGTLEALGSAPDLRVNRIEVTLPVELSLRQIGDEVQLIGDIPQSVTRTAFDLQPGRIEVVWEIEELS
ncbi:hypothetical protein [Methylobacter tundripaludum]|uniref:hypothetical protein n=1 Tax=Methylobacter tundripaludum TaxID=173365 RepID=UPI00048896D4|nr:hypothetical protein [Methylobacter tundripaludum]